ncbi:hypothetical protein ACFFH2_00210 [Enterococcus devriesei]|uniref:Uncharacterized protein n=1 Tax=Enterococcus devriesei TaxID=319970 RepID=A0A1L8SUA8_9ENTE|nr:hypothetical protein [Enterococcus devriesei]OJG35641.1 hypothetical protein RV00_GL002395 [Enterococcus devriesei]
MHTIEHHKIISDFRLLSGLTVTIEDCANLTKEFQVYGVEDYYISDYKGNSYLTRYVDYFIDAIPCLKYKKNYFIPLIFRDMPDTQKMFRDPYRWEAFFILLDWYLTYNPKKVLVPCSQKKADVEIVDTAFLIFRLWEIYEGSAFPIANLNNLSEFEKWNKVFHLIDTENSFTRNKEFDTTKVEDLTQLETVITIIKLKYQALLQKQGYRV